MSFSNTRSETGPIMAKDYSRRRLFIETAFLALIAVLATIGFRQHVYPAFGLDSEGPLPGRTIILALAILAMAKAHPRGLAGIGLKWGGHNWLVFLFAAVIVAANLFLLTPLRDAIATAFDVPPSEIGPLSSIQGNLTHYVAWLAITWTAAAFGEEIIFRGYLLNRVAEALGRNWIAWTIAVLLQALIFSLGHAYQGIGGVLRIGVGAIFSGLFFLLFRRSLWPLIIAHGVWDTLGITLIYLHGVPSTD